MLSTYRGALLGLIGPLLFFGLPSSSYAAVTAKQHLFIGDSFPTCVDVIDVRPPPGTLLNSSEISFTITFSRYVYRLHIPWRKRWRYLPLVVLSPTLHVFDRVIAGSIQFRTSETNEMTVTFHVSSDYRRIYK